MGQRKSRDSLDQSTAKINRRVFEKWSDLQSQTNTNFLYEKTPLKLQIWLSGKSYQQGIVQDTEIWP